MVRRTTISLDSELDRLLDREAKRRNVSRSDVIRDALRATLAGNGNGEGHGERKKTGDPFFDNHMTFDGPVPPDLSENHDKYLYGEPEEA